MDLLFLSLSDSEGRATAPLQALKGRTFYQTHWHNHIHFGLSVGQKMLQANSSDIRSSASSCVLTFPLAQVYIIIAINIYLSLKVCANDFSISYLYT